MTHALQLKNVRKAYQGHVAVKGLDLEVPTGSVFGLLGPNGAGKTTSIRMAMDIIGPDTGEVLILGQKGRQSPARPDRLHARGARPLPEDDRRGTSRLHGGTEGGPARGFEKADAALARETGPRRLAQEEGERTFKGHAAEGPVHPDPAPRPRHPHPRRAHERSRSRRHQRHARRHDRTLAGRKDPDREFAPDGHGRADVRPRGPHQQGREGARRPRRRHQGELRQEHHRPRLRGRRVVPEDRFPAWPR